MEINARLIRDKDPKRQEELRKLQTEERCFGCGKLGHINRNCPNWLKEARKPPPYTLKTPSYALKARATKLSHKEEEEKEQTIEEIAKAMRGMTDVTGSWNEASLYASWTGVSFRTGQVWICLIASLYDWLMVALVTDGPGGCTYVVWLV
jgi:hypothetical protein